MSYHRPAAGLCAATALFVCGIAGFPVPPSALPESEGRLVLGSSQTSTFAPGARVTVSAGGFADEAAVTVAMYSTPKTLAQVTADRSGDVDATVTLPRRGEGTHTLIAMGLAPNGTAHNVQTRITINDPTVSASDLKALAYTGVNTAGILAGALGMLVAGFVLVRGRVFGRRFLPTT